MSGSEQKLTFATSFDCLYEVPGDVYSDSTSTLELREDLEKIKSSVKGNNESTTTLFRQINTCFECAGIELTPRRFFNIIILRVGGDALEILGQNRRLVECLNDTSVATSDDMVTCKNLLMTFAPNIQETKKDWIEDLAGLKQESTESLESYHNRAAIILKNLDLVDGAKNCSMAEKHLLSIIYM
ncbi:hypothetical protein EPUL_006035, partial [Erysiphe pulchra]